MNGDNLNKNPNEADSSTNPNSSTPTGGQDVQANIGQSATETPVQPSPSVTPQTAEAPVSTPAQPQATDTSSASGGSVGGSSPATDGGNKKYFMIAIIVIVVIAIGVVLFIFKDNIFGGGSPGDDVDTIEDTVKLDQDAKISLSVKKNNFLINEEVEVDIFIDTPQEISGADILIEYDPEILELVVNSISGEVSGLSIAEGNTILTNIPKSEIREMGDKNILAFSAISNPTKTFKGNAKVAVVKFKAISEGQTSLVLVFVPGSTHESNIGSGGGQDILGSVENVSITVTN